MSMSVPDVTLRKRLIAVAVVGVLLACSGLTQIVLARNLADFNGARLWLLAAWLLLMPLFVYMMRLRGKGKRAARDLALQQKAQLDQDTAALLTPDGIRRAGGIEPQEPA